MKRFLTVLLVLGLLFMVGCYLAPADSEPASSEPTDSEPIDSSETTTPTNSDGAANDSEDEEDEPDVMLSEEPPENVTWISPGKVRVGNFYPGARAEWNLLVHNGSDTKTSFSVSYRYPDHVGEEYAFPTEAVQDWVIVADATPVIMPKETREILIVLAMPKDAAVFASQWEFWISVKDQSQSGMVRTELCTRWLITMRP